MAEMRIANHEEIIDELCRPLNAKGGQVSDVKCLHPLAWVLVTKIKIRFCFSCS